MTNSPIDMLYLICIKVRQNPNTQEMDTNYLVNFLSRRLDSIGGPFSTCYCFFEGALSEYREAASLLGACGHDTSELKHAISEAEKAIKVLKVQREIAVSRFKANGVCFTVDGRKRKEIKQAQLQ